MFGRFVTSGAVRVAIGAGEAGQTTAEYALVILGAVAIATLADHLGDREPRDLAAVRHRDRARCSRRDRASLVPPRPARGDPAPPRSRPRARAGDGRVRVRAAAASCWRSSR